MANLRLVWNNLADKATIVAESTAGSLTVDNLKNDYKTLVHRSVGRTQTYTLTWPYRVQIGGVILPICNLSASSTIQFLGYDETDTLRFDSTETHAAPGVGWEAFSWSEPLNVNAFSQGVGTKVAKWLTEQDWCVKLVIILKDPNNLVDYIDVGRLIVGPYWEPKANAEYGAEVGQQDDSINTRTASGDLRSDRRTRHDLMNFTLGGMREDDRAVAQRIFDAVGITRPMFISVLPENHNPTLEQKWMIYGKRDNSLFRFLSYDQHDNNVSIKGW